MKSCEGLWFGALCAAVITMSGPAASAATLFSDLGSGQSYSNVKPWLISPTDTTAFSFVVAASGSVSEIDAAFIDASGASATVNLWTDNGGATGAELGSWTVSGFPTDTHLTSGGLVTIRGISGIELTAGDTYFLQAGPADGNTLLWAPNSQGLTSILQTSVASASGKTTGAFDVLGASAAPEPATWAMLILGLGMIGLAVRRRNAAVLAAR